MCAPPTSRIPVTNQQPLLVAGLLGRWGQIWVLQTCRPELGSPNRREERKGGSSNEQFKHISSGLFLQPLVKGNLVNEAVSSCKRQNENSAQTLSRSLHEGGAVVPDTIKICVHLVTESLRLWPTSFHLLREILRNSWTRGSAYSFYMGPHKWHNWSCEGSDEAIWGAVVAGGEVQTWQQGKLSECQRLNDRPVPSSPALSPQVTMHLIPLHSPVFILTFSNLYYFNQVEGIDNPLPFTPPCSLILIIPVLLVPPPHPIIFIYFWLGLSQLLLHAFDGVTFGQTEWFKEQASWNS